MKRKTSYILSILGISGLLLLSANTTQAASISENTQETSSVSVNETAETELDNEQATILYSGKDEDLDWSIDSDGLLTISGEGDYLFRDWCGDQYNGLIKKAKIEDFGGENGYNNIDNSHFNSFSDHFNNSQVQQNN